MSERVKKAGSVTIILWLLAALALPVVSYIASNALQIPRIVTQLEHLVATNTAIVKELKEFRIKDIAEDKLNREEHRQIIKAMNRNTVIIGTLKEDYSESREDIRNCNQRIDYGK